MGDTLLSVIENEFEALFEPITLAVDDPGWLARLLTELGIDPSDVDDAPFVNALSTVVDFKKHLSVLAANSSPSLEEIGATLSAAGRLFNALRSIDSANGMSRALDGIAEDFVQWLITNHLSYAHRRLREAYSHSPRQWQRARTFFASRSRSTVFIPSALSICCAIQSRR